MVGEQKKASRHFFYPPFNLPEKIILGWIVIDKHYDDGGFSGGNMNRPGLQMLFADIKSGQIDIVVTYKIDRLSRSLLDFSKINDFFESSHVGFVSVTQDINTNYRIIVKLLNCRKRFCQYSTQ